MTCGSGKFAAYTGFSKPDMLVAFVGSAVVVWALPPWQAARAAGHRSAAAAAATRRGCVRRTVIVIPDVYLRPELATPWMM